MSDAWDAVRATAAAKFADSSVLAVAGLRSASADVDDPLVLPAVRVLQPTYTLDWQTGVTEAYTLDVPFEIVVNRPSGRKRAEPIAATIARAAQVEWQSGYLMSMDLGLASITGAQLLSMEPGLSEYAESDDNGRPVYDGYRGVLRFSVQESVTRSA